MAIIKKTIKGLRPGADYLFTTKPKNTEVSASDNPPDAIRVTVPTYSVAPGTITNFQLVARFETLFFTFNPVTDIDLDYYEFQIFSNQFGTGTPISARLSLSGDGQYISGFNKSNSFTVSVQNSEVVEVGVLNYGYSAKVRAVNTSKVPSPWSSLAMSGNTPLIGEEYIQSLNASRITTGTLQGATINMSGSSSMIKSDIYDFAASPTQGWYIRGDGHFSLGGQSGINYNGSSVVIGTGVNIQAEANVNSLTVGSDPYLRIDDDLQGGTKVGMEVGDPTYNYWYTTGEFRAGDDKSFLEFNPSSGLEISVGVANTGLRVDSTGKVWAGNDVYSSAPFRLDQTGKITVGTGTAASAEALRVNGTMTIAGTTSVSGNLTVSGTTTLTGPVTTQGTITTQGTVVATTIQSHSIVPQTDAGVISWRIKTEGVNTGFYGYLGTTQIIKVGSEINITGNITAAQANFIHTSGQATIRATRSYFFGGGNQRLIAFINSDSGDAVGGIEFTSSSSVAYRTTSDERLKVEIKKEIGNLEKILKISPKLFYWKDDKDKKEILGLFAQQVYEVYPQAVSVGTDDAKEYPWMIDYASLVPLIIGSIKELSDKINALQ